jgi:hypothetical protein
VIGGHQKYFGETQQSKLMKTRRDSAEVHAECTSVLVHLMENMQARKTSSVIMIEWQDLSVGPTPYQIFRYWDFGYRSWRCQEISLQES